MKLDPRNLDTIGAHHLLADVIVPRPIAWVSTVDEHGVYNLAPFSAYGWISARPAVVGFSVGSRRDGSEKDTIRNVRASKEFVINVVNEDLAEKMNITSASFPRDVSEFKEAGLTPVKADLVKAPLVAESPINMECRVLRILDFKEAGTGFSFIIGEVLRVHIKDEIYVKGNVDMSRLKAIGRLGGGTDLYCRTTDVFEIKRPA